MLWAGWRVESFGFCSCYCLDCYRKSTRTTIASKLRLKDCRSNLLSPDRPNIHLGVWKLSPSDVSTFFAPLIRQLMVKRINCGRVFVYCQKISVCAGFYLTFMQELADFAYWPYGADQISDNRLVRMFHSGTPEYNKEIILRSLEEPNGVCRVLFATSAVGMGVDVQGLHYVVHYGPPSSTEHYMQEIVRAGREGLNSRSILIYNGMQLQKCEKTMLEYVKASSGCRISMLLKSFDESIQHEYFPIHLCCDLCAAQCVCELDHGELFSMSSILGQHTESPVQDFAERSVTKSDEIMAEVQLRELFQSSWFADLSITVLGQIIENLKFLFTVDDIMDKIDVQTFSQAEGIFEVLCDIFTDMK